MNANKQINYVLGNFFRIQRVDWVDIQQGVKNQINLNIFKKVLNSDGE